MKTNTYKNKTRHRIAFIALLTLTLTMGMAQPTKAISLKIPSFSAIFGLSANAESTNTFPEIGDSEPRQVVYMTMTAYSSDVGQTDDSPCIPADWKYNLCENYAQTGAQDTIATNFLPLGTKVRFPELYGDKIFTVRDRMNARYGYGRGDIWMPSRDEAVTFGVKRVQMEIYYR